jgi:hypothetical protein
VRRGVRAGYDRPAETYDATPNPLVSLDCRYTPAALEAPPVGEELMFDAGCGTGLHLGSLCRAEPPVGLDFSRGMLRGAADGLRGTTTGVFAKGSERDVAGDPQWVGLTASPVQPLRSGPRPRVGLVYASRLSRDCD